MNLFYLRYNRASLRPSTLNGVGRLRAGPLTIAGTGGGWRDAWHGFCTARVCRPSSEGQARLAFRLYVSAIPFDFPNSWAGLGRGWCLAALSTSPIGVTGRRGEAGERVVLSPWSQGRMGRCRRPMKRGRSPNASVGGRAPVAGGGRVCVEMAEPGGLFRSIIFAGDG